MDIFEACVIFSAIQSFNFCKWNLWIIIVTSSIISFQNVFKKTRKLCFLKTVIFESKRLVVKCFGGWNTGPWIIDFSQNTIRSQEITMKSKMIKAMFFGAWWRKRSDFWPNEIKICWLRSMDSFYFDYQLISHVTGADMKFFLYEK